MRHLNKHRPYCLHLTYGPLLIIEVSPYVILYNSLSVYRPSHTENYVSLPEKYYVLVLDALTAYCVDYIRFGYWNLSCGEHSTVVDYFWQVHCSGN